jgi:Trypsin-like peptidase domain
VSKPTSTHNAATGASWVARILLGLLLLSIVSLVFAGVELYRLLNTPSPTSVLDQRVMLMVPTLAPIPTPAAVLSTPIRAGQPPSTTPLPTSAPATVPSGDTIQTVMRSVVQVRTETGFGTGFRVSGGNVPRFITNAHMVDKAITVVLITSDGKEHSATVLGKDNSVDLALLGAADLGGIPALALSDTAPRTGDPLYVVGFALGSSLLGDPTVTRGIVSGRRMVGTVDYVQTDAAMNPGNSGGPAIGVDGKVVGVATWGIRQDAGVQIQGVNFAIPASAIRRFLELH